MFATSFGSDPRQPEGGAWALQKQEIFKYPMATWRERFGLLGPLHLPGAQPQIGLNLFSHNTLSFYPHTGGSFFPCDLRMKKQSFSFFYTRVGSWSTLTITIAQPAYRQSPCPLEVAFSLAITCPSWGPKCRPTASWMSDTDSWSQGQNGLSRSLGHSSPWTGTAGLWMARSQGRKWVIVEGSHETVGSSWGLLLMGRNMRWSQSTSFHFLPTLWCLGRRVG